MKKRVGILGMLLSLCLLITGCGGEETPSSQEPSASVQTTQQNTVQDEEAYTFVDDASQKITLEQRPQKVAVLLSSFVDIWQTAGGSVDITVGESVERALVEEDVLLVDGGAGKTIDNELLISYEPDFVICSMDIEAQAESAELCNQAGIPAAQFHVDSFEEYLDMLKICTDILDTPEAYEMYGLQVQSRIEEILASAQMREPREILFVRAGSKYSATKAKTAKDNFVCVMLQELGTYNIAENAPVLLDGLSFEEILLEDPDIIFITTMGDEEAAKAYMTGVLAEEQWQQLSAVQEGNYYFLPKDLFHFKPNARWAEAYEYLLDLLYPEETNE